MTHIDIVFDRLPDASGANFVEVEDATGASIKLGEWVTRDDGYVALRIPDRTVLADASSVPEPGVSPSNAAEFAALWNSRSPEQREKLVQLLLDQQERAHKCFMEDHEGLKAAAKRSVNADVVLAALGSLGVMLHDDKMNPMVRVSNARHRVASLMNQVEQQAPERASAVSNRWTTEQKHRDCVPCEEAVEMAIETAQQTGQAGASWKVMTPITKPDGSFGGTAEHVGTVKRSA